MKKLLLAAIAISTLAGCSKDADNSGPCMTGTVLFRNLSNDTYKMYIDGQLIGNIQPNESSDKPFEIGKHILKAEQVTSSNPTIRTKEVDIVGCDNYEFAFP